MTKSGFFSTLQNIGKSLMIPVSVLPAAGLLVALGRLAQNFALGEGGTVVLPSLHAVGQVMFSGGLAIFEQLPVVFAVGVAIGFTQGAGVAGLSAVVAYFTMTNVLKVVGELRSLDLSINTGVFGGIIVGLVAAKLYQRFFKIKLHPVLGFFAGKRFVPIASAGAAILVGVVLGFFWPPIQNQINAFGVAVMGSDFGPAFYAAGKRLLIPVGLHHFYYPPFLFEFGDFVTETGKVLHGESPRYFSGDPTAGRFMASEFPIMLFGLPAATLAMVLRAKKSKRKAITGIMVSAALTSIITGITEPIEFAFIFVAPILYVFHVLAAFGSGLLTGYFDIHLGYTFSASLIDYGLGFFNQKNSMYLFTVVGPLMAVTYFSVFYVAIGALDLKTPGREAEDEGEGLSLSFSDKAAAILYALGDAVNIKHLDACITRLRLTVFDESKVDQKHLKEIGAAGIMKAGGGNYQVIFGTESDQLKDEMHSIIEKGGLDAIGWNPASVQTKTTEVTKNEVLAAGTSLSILSAPLSGQIVSMKDVPDATFADKILGDGIAIDPSEGILRAPIDGTIATLFRTKHAIGIRTENGLEVLIHIGIDTVKLEGRGFTAFVKQGDVVKRGDKLIEFDMDLLRRESKSMITPVLITNMAAVKGLKTLNLDRVREGEELLEVEI